MLMLIYIIVRAAPILEGGGLPEPCGATEGCLRGARAGPPARARHRGAPCLHASGY